ncbi:MAG: hypothetical protein H0U70_03850 [Tatlockia sp.]|nr:hypothetical protein [Tatlockia sp.]
MKKFNLIILLILFSVFLSSCATVYHPPKASEPTSLVRVKNERSGLATWISLQVEEIDNRSAGLQLMPGNLRIYPGIHTLTIKSMFNKGFFSSGPFEAFSDIKADFKANEAYIVQAKVDGAQLLVWISDKTGRRISSLTKTPYRTAARPMILLG